MNQLAAISAELEVVLDSSVVSAISLDMSRSVLVLPVCDSATACNSTTLCLSSSITPFDLQRYRERFGWSIILSGMVNVANAK